MRARGLGRLVVLIGGIGSVSIPQTANAGLDCIWIRTPKVNGIGVAPCSAGQARYQYYLSQLSCSDDPCTGASAEYADWERENMPTLNTPEICDNPWSGLYVGCSAKPEPTPCQTATATLSDNASTNCVGDPVDLTTGALEQTVVDVDLGGGLRFARHYSSNAFDTSAMGWRWRHGLDWRLAHQVLPSGGSLYEAVRVYRAFGRRTVAFLRPVAGGQWMGGAKGAGSLAGDSASGFTYTDDDGTRVEFDPSGGSFVLASLRVPGSPAIAVSHGTDSSTFTGSRSTLVVNRYAAGHANAGRVSSVVANGSSTWTYTYFSDQRLQTVTGPDDSTPSPTDTLVWTYSYGTSARLTKVERTAGGVTATLGQWAYNSSGRVTSADEPALDQALALSYGVSGGVVISTDVRESGVGGSLLASYDFYRGRITEVTGSGGPGVDVPFAEASFVPLPAGGTVGFWQTVTDENGHQTRYEDHDERGRAGLVVEGWIDADSSGTFTAGDGFARLREYTHHPALDAFLTVTEPSAVRGAQDKVTTYDYDDPAAPGDTTVPNEAPTDRLHRKILSGFTLDASGQAVAFSDETTYEYDGEGRVTASSGPRAEQHTEIDYDATSGSRSAVRRYLDGPASAYLEWTFSDFDAQGRPQTVTDPNGRETAFTYDLAGRVLTATPPDPGAASTTVSFTYDVDGQLTRIDFPPDSDSAAVYLRLGYDAKGNLTFLADSAGNALVYEYEKGRATREARYTGFVDLTSRGTLVGDATFSYTAAGDLFRAFNPLFGGNTVYSELDHNPKGNPTGITDENGREDVLLYDALDRLEAIQQVRSLTYETGFAYDPASNVTAVTDAAGKTTDLLHDDRGDLVQTISPDTGTTLFLTDAAGNLVQKIEDAGGSAERVTSYEYDGLDRLLEIDLPNDPDWVFSYDTSTALNQKGRLASVTNGAVTTELEYTQRGDVAVERTILDGLAYEVSYGYDAAGNRISITGPSGSRVETRYSGLRPAQLDVIAGATTHEIQDLAWYPFGPRTQAKLPPADGSGDDTVVSTRTINLRGQIEELDVTAASGAILDRSYRYAYTAGSPGPNDPGPNLDQVIDHLDASESRFYFYDELDRLAAAKDLSGTTLHAYGYDAAGNRTTKQGPLGSSSYSYEIATNRLDAATGAEARDYVHDAYGNRIYEGTAAFASAASLVYDDANRLVVAKDPAAGFATLGTYTYDAFGRRVEKVASGKTVLSFYDSEGHLVEEVEKVSGSDDRARLYVFLEDELLGLVDRELEVGAAEGPLGIRLPLDLAPELAVLLLAVVSGVGVALATRRLPAGVATAGSGVALLLVCASGSSSPVFSWVHTDPLGRPLAVTGTPTLPGDVEAIWRAGYEPFGKVIVDEDPDGDSLDLALQVRLPGQYEDAETGWYYNLFRQYDPTTGRFLEPDSDWLDDRRSDYAYAHLNPIGKLDHSGRWALPATWLAMQALARAALYVGSAGLAALTVEHAINDDSSPSDDTAAPPQTCDPREDCAWLSAQIQIELAEVRRRYFELFQDRLDLYHRRPTGKFSRQGHEQQYNERQTRLRALTQRARARGCPYDPQADFWASQSMPRPWWAWLP